MYAIRSYYDYTDEDYEFYGITNHDSLSAASKRALMWPESSRDNSWFMEFSTHDLKGDFAYEEGVVRRDPSAVIKVDGKYMCCRITSYNVCYTKLLRQPQENKNPTKKCFHILSSHYLR